MVVDVARIVDLGLDLDRRLVLPATSGCADDHDGTVDNHETSTAM